MADYAVYKGDELLVLGSLQECAKALDVKEKTIQFYATKTHKNRTKGKENNMLAIRIEEDEE
jgi:hypothetical protein